MGEASRLTTFRTNKRYQKTGSASSSLQSFSSRASPAVVSDNYNVNGGSDEENILKVGFSDNRFYRKFTRAARQPVIPPPSKSIGTRRFKIYIERRVKRQIFGLFLPVYKGRSSSLINGGF
ncbi:MAG: hypothetical protein IH840_14970 [Candidatus Heimdallarchaeota archaeon]|nr:hypothetical protein [Candidatus Heimdallarchaeota archaeon]